jgi:hypothetical protein
LISLFFPCKSAFLTRNELSSVRIHFHDTIS